jgi:2-polyprenyl-3-methyl-5-hydroxy-6-metoxy-1,4-benzoquinol methylase
MPFRATPPRGLFSRAAQSFLSHGARAPANLLLGGLRRRAKQSVIDRYRSRIDAIHEAAKAGDPRGRRALEALANLALVQMRRAVEADALRVNLAERLAALSDGWWRRTEAREYLDDPLLDEKVRVRILENLDAMNSMIGSYAAFCEQLKPLAHPDRPTRVLDLAAGHGGFALELARNGRSGAFALDLTASDIKREYLEIGAARARREALPVRFVVQDALDLSAVPERSYDVVVCTQSLHHFSPGQVAVMFSEAGRVASRGVLFIDGARGALNAALVSWVGFLLFHDAALAHDTWVSFRRFFVAEELELLADLGPWGSRSAARWIPPSHCILELDKTAGWGAG